jgi:enterochelin esterase family protein
MAAFALVLVCVSLSAQNQQPAATPVAPAAPSHRPKSPEVHADRSVTLRFAAPNAKNVQLFFEGAKPAPMTKDDSGIWSITVAPLEPDYYSYSFIADGVFAVDPANHWLKPNLIATQSMLHVPGPSSLPWEINDVPHGDLHHHFYQAKVTNDFRDYYVYTPPGYDPRGNTNYPVLYLLHGFSDDAMAWPMVGKANIILDNLVYQGKARPMIVVMPLGYGNLEVVRRGFGAFDDTRLRDDNFSKFTEELLTEIIPQVETSYAVEKDQKSRAIAGLSMGGSETLLTGLNHLDKFAWIASFSAGGLPENYEQYFPGLSSPANNKLKLLWIACGTEDFLIGNNRKFRDWLKTKNVNHVDIETPGAHTWLVWRRNLATVAPLLFR